MEKEVWAAVIQAVPIGAAAWVGWRGLNTWRRQLREGRQIKHAEKAHAAAEEMFVAIRTARLPGFSVSAEVANNSERLKAGVDEIRSLLLKNGRDAWRRFQDHYALARLYAPNPAQLNVARVVEGCINSLEGSARLMRIYERGDPQYIDAWNAFRGSLTEEPDDVEKQLREAEKGWDGELRSIIRLAKDQPPAGRLARLRAAWHGR